MIAQAMPNSRMPAAAKMSASCQPLRPPPSELVETEVDVGAGVGVVCACGSGANGLLCAGGRRGRGEREQAQQEERDPAEHHGHPAMSRRGAGRRRPPGSLQGPWRPSSARSGCSRQGGLAAMQQLETRSDEELEREQKYKAAAQAILGARAAERYDAKASREHFRRALAAARPQERMALRRMADASLALAERRPDDLKAAVEQLGQAPPSSRQLLLLRFMGLVAPPASAGTAGPRARHRDHHRARRRAHRPRHRARRARRPGRSAA